MAKVPPIIPTKKILFLVGVVGVFSAVGVKLAARILFNSC